MRQMAKMGKKDLFENHSTQKAFFRLALPTVFGQIIMVIYNMADTFFVGLAGNDAMLAAITVCMPAFMFLSAISNLFGIGGASVIARALGSKDERRVKNTSAFAFWGCMTTVAVYSVSVLIWRDLFTDLLGGTNAAVHANAVEYLSVSVVLGGIGTALSGLFSHLIRAEGRAVHASTGIMLGGILNILRGRPINCVNLKLRTKISAASLFDKYNNYSVFSSYCQQ